MKQILKLSLLLLAILLPATAAAYDFEVDGIYYNIIKGNEAEVTYGGNMDGTPPPSYSGNVTIPSSVIYEGTTYDVTAIGYFAFISCRELKKITISNSVTSIGNGAFSDCYALTSINIPNSVTTIGNYAFTGCTGLTSITIPNSVTSITDRLFFDCTGLTTVTIPNSVTSIGDEAFMECYGLTNINIPNSVTTIGYEAFRGCTGLSSISISNSVTSITGRVFFDCTGLTTVTIPNSVTSIGDEAFMGCSGLTSINIPNSVTTIGDRAFDYCPGLTRVTIPNSVTSIGSSAFDGCLGLTIVTIPNSVTFVGRMAFGNIPAIESVTCAATTPPSSDGIDLFSNNVYIHAPLYVPTGSERAYMADPCWGQFINIIGLEDEVLATSISLSKPQVNLLVGGTSQLVATVLPDSTTNKTVAWASSNPNVATVSNDGMVTALAAGTTTVTAMTTDGSNLSASCLIGVTEDFSDYDDYLLLSDMEAFHGDTIVIPVTMVNASNITAFQTDIFLPEGLELLKEDGEYLIDPSERMTRSHSLISDDVSNGAIRVVCYSSNYRPFTGESGDDLFYLTVKVADDTEGDYIVHLKNTLLTNTDFDDIVAPDVDGTINVKAYILGDANDSRTVTITDVVVTAQYVLERNPQPFIFEAADVNKDNYITIADVARIAWMVLNPDEAKAPMRTSVIMDCSDHMSGEGITLATGETRTVSIALNNAMDYTACQLDLRLPEGLEASNFRLTDRAGSHVFDVNTLHNGDIRVLCYSPALTAIGGHVGTLLTFDVTATAPVTGDIAVDDIELVTTACQTVKPDGFVIGVNAATSINEIAGSKTVARVEYFNLAGQQIDRPDSGVTLVVTTYTDGTRTTTKLIR